MKIAVIGAGVVGLSTAVNILQDVPDAAVTVIADKFGKETTSSGAGGHFRPNIGHIQGVSMETLKKWSKVSRDHYYGLAMSSEAKASGNMFMSGYLLLDKPEEGVLEDIVLHFRPLLRKEMDSLNFKQRYGYVYTTVVTEMKKYLVWLSSRIVKKGGSIEKRKVASLQELVGHYDIVVNCCGLGARELLGDTAIHPVKGQLVKVRAPWINMFYTCESNGVSTYIYPHSDTVNLGGSRVAGNSSKEPDLEVAEDIIRRTKELVPALEGAVFMENWAGLRPTRTPLRLESEVINIDGKQLRVIHNYGHGALGITLAWGTAVEATELVKKWREDHEKRADIKYLLRKGISPKEFQEDMHSTLDDALSYCAFKRGRETAEDDARSGRRCIK